ncbi:hypothetical protein K438DRAFT_449066 [Mycena galopus ATCC 62051]|nr:hypothetical protein K438DRAFT_449066 [Mycena galopus ATCC 62051]
MAISYGIPSNFALPYVSSASLSRYHRSRALARLQLHSISKDGFRRREGPDAYISPNSYLTSRSLPILLSLARNKMPLRRRHRDSVSHANEDDQINAPVKQRFVKGFDVALFLLLVHGGITVAWGAALMVFSTGIVPINWGLSQYGQLHPGITNVVVTGVATLSTTYLKVTVQYAAEEYAAMQLYEGLTLRKWSWLQGIAMVQTWPPFRLRQKSTWAWVAWLVMFGSMAGHSASIVAILQPQTFFDHVPFDDNAIPCGSDPASLSLNATCAVQAEMDQYAFNIGLQFLNYCGTLVW